MLKLNTMTMRNINLDKVKKIISNPKIKVISFDIFDTLLVRPVIQPKDIFYLLSRRKLKYKKNSFMDLRYNAESKVNKSNINIYDIWNSIAKEYNLSVSEKEELFNEEIKLEANMLYSRKIGYDLYNFALNLGKRIIFTSDMYLPSSILKDILYKKGYKTVKQIYVSCECHCRKENGELYKYVLKSEQVTGKHILHIGDNYNSDYKMAKKAGCRAIWIPSNLELFLNNKSISNNIHFEDLIKMSYNDRILCGFVINKIYEQYSPRLCDLKLNLSTFSHLFILPILIDILVVTNKNNFTSKYDKLFLAARDGFLPLKALDRLAEYKKDTLKHKYFMASRQAYSCVIYPTPYSRLEQEKFKSGYTLKQYLESIILDPILLESIKKQLSESEQNLQVSDNKGKCKRILQRFDSKISPYYKKRQKITEEYYEQNIRSTKKRIAVFDCGYSGSISVALSKVLHNKFKVDKVYLYQYSKNKKRDIKNNTKTYVLFNKKAPWFDILLETMFSPLVGSCKGFVKENQKIIPIFEEYNIGIKMKNDITLVQDSALNGVSSFVQLFNEYWDNFEQFNLILYANTMAKLFNKNRNNTKIFENIEFIDSYLTNNVTTLKEKIDGKNIIERIFEKIKI